MKINLVKCDKEVKEAILELKELLSIYITEAGFNVYIEQGNGKEDIIVKKDGNRVDIIYREKHDIFRGLFLLASNVAKKEFEISQTCAFEDFGILIDISRNAVMNMKTTKDIVRHIAVLGYKTLELYTEDTIKVESEEYFGYMRGALKKEEIKEIDNYCNLFGIELVPCIQTLAHINQITRYERYNEMIDVNDILLVGEERTYEFLENIFKTASENFTSRRINIGMDEAHMLGFGKYIDKNGYRARFDIMLEHLEKVKELCKKYNFNPEMWSDMFFRLVYGGEYYSDNEDVSLEAFDKIPKDIKLIYWDYYSTDYDRYKGMISKHLKISDNIGFAGGAWKWTGFTADNEFSLETLSPAIRACKDNKIKSFLLTCWGDNGAEASIYSVLPSIYYNAEKAYVNNLEEVSNLDIAAEEFDKEKFTTLTKISFDEYMMVDLPNNITDEKGKCNNASKFFLYNDLLIGTFDSLATDGIGKKYEEYGEKLKVILSKDSSYKETFNTMQKLCEVLSIKAELGVKIKKAYDLKDMHSLGKIVNNDLVKLSQKLKEFYEIFLVQWHKENKSFGFEVQCARLGALMLRVDYVKNRLEEYIDNKIESIEELEEERKAFAYMDTNDVSQVNYNLWNIIISPSVV